MPKTKKLKKPTPSEIQKRKTIELGAERLAEIFISQIDEQHLSKNKDSSDSAVGN
ncbi:MAG: hypothetical protein PHT16_01490 [Candidatus Pacebacteria bacterium]|nr:hypothetical protein [Candidatus Paceibacterota bacterium]